MDSDFESILNNTLNAFDVNHGLTELEDTQEEEQEQTLDFTKYETNQTEIIDTSRSRFSGASWFDKFDTYTITLAGLGGIGSWTAIHIARLNPKQIVLWDPDYIEMANLSGQLFSLSDVGCDKTNVIRRQIARYAKYFAVDAYVSKFSTPTEIVICGFDNMEARKTAYGVWKKEFQNYKPGVFIDARLSAEQLQIFTIGGGDEYSQKKYEKEWLFTDKDAEQTVCSYKQTSFCAAIIGGLITNSLVNYIDNYNNKIPLRNQPFMISYDAKTMYLKTSD